DPGQALDLYKEAVKIEQGNLRIEAQIAKAYFLLNDCDGADNQADGILQTHPWHQEGMFLLAQAKVCKSSPLNLKESQLTVIQDDFIKSYIMAAQYYLQKDHLTLLRETEISIKKFPEFGELYWFRSRALLALKQDAAKE